MSNMNDPNKLFPQQAAFQPPQQQSIFSSILNAGLPAGSAEYFSPGEYIVQWTKAKQHVSQNPRTAGKHQFIAEFTVMATDAEGTSAGAKRSWVSGVMADYEQKDINSLIVYGLQGDVMTPQQFAQQLDAAGSVDLPDGCFVRLRAMARVGKQSGKPWTKHQWEALTPAERSQLAQPTAPAPAAAPAPVAAAPVQQQTWPADPPPGWPEGMKWPPV